MLLVSVLGPDEIVGIGLIAGGILAKVKICENLSQFSGPAGD